MKWIRNLMDRRRRAQDAADEVASHIEERIADLMESGIAQKEARQQANREFGNAVLITESAREVWKWRWLDRIGQDLRYALRGLRRDPLLALTAALTLAICIGANTTVFSIVNSILLRPLPYPGSERIEWLGERMGPGQEVGLAADYYSLREQNRVFEDVAAYGGFSVNWSGIEKPEQLDAAQVTPSFFRVMGTEPLMGRYLAPEEQGEKAPAVVVLSYTFWHNRLGSDPRAVGKTIMLDRLPNTIIGVMPQGFDYPRGMQIFRPLPVDEASQRPRLTTRPMRLVNLLARLKPGVSPQQLATEMSRLTANIRREYPKEFESAGFLKGMAITARPLQARLTGDVRPALLVLSGAVGLVLLIACVNVANLLLARASARQRELAVRLALGSHRRRIIQQMLTESMMLALPGGLAGIALAYFAVAALNAWKPLALENYPPISMDVVTLAFTFALTLVTGLVFGMAPAAAAVRVSIHDALKSGGQTLSGGRPAARLRQLLVVAELGVSLVLLIGAGLLARSFVKLAQTDLGFPAGNLLTMRVNLVGAPYATAESRKGFYDDVLQRLRRLPVVRHAAVSTEVPLEDGWQSIAMFEVAGRAPVPMAQRPQAEVVVVSRDFFQTIGVPLRAGRIFDLQDHRGSTDKIIVNEAFARQIFSGENPLGQRLTLGENGGPQWTIVGVVGNIRASALGAEPGPFIYRCACQTNSLFEPPMALVVRTTAGPRAAIRSVEGQVYAVDRNQPVFAVKTMDDRLDAALAPQRFHLMLIGCFAAIALVLSAVGVYGVMSYLVTRRTREIGIRMAMGARPGHVVSMVVGESVVLAVASIAAGLGGAWWLTRYLQSMLYGVTALDGVTFAIMPIILATLAVAASFAPAWRASRTDPTTALREE
jgi:putative ABC transport system permease protein